MFRFAANPFLSYLVTGRQLGRFERVELGKTSSICLPYSSQSVAASISPPGLSFLCISSTISCLNSRRLLCRFLGQGSGKKAKIAERELSLTQSLKT